MKQVLLIWLTTLSVTATAQVNAIKSASSASSTEGRGGASSSGGFIADFAFQFMFSNVVGWQEQTLSKRDVQRSLISIDGWVQGGGQPSSYYLLQPRVRANWGIVSSDFRLSYVIEEDFGEARHIRTTDWQLIQLNFVTEKDVTARVGIGMIWESFGQRNSYGEWTTAIHVHPFEKRLSGVAEYRWAEARKELNGHVRYALLEKKKIHPYLLFGAAFQRYYSEVNVWGIQGGIGISFY